MPTNPTGLFAHPISNNDLLKGLAKEFNVARDNNFLLKSDGAVGYSGSLATVPDMSESRIDTSGINSIWPFPQIERLTKTTFLFTQDSIFIYKSGVFTLLWSGDVVITRWAVADFLDFIIMSNGKYTLEYRLSSNSIAPSEQFDYATNLGVPACRACLNYNSQLLVGGI